MHTSTLAVAGGCLGGVRHVWAALLVPPSTLFFCDSVDRLARLWVLATVSVLGLGGGGSVGHVRLLSLGHTSTLFLGGIWL